jgi:HEAT repeat protein
MRNFVVLVLAVLPAGLVGGCSKTPPTLAGGKPVGHWVQALQDPDARVRKRAAFRLGNVGPADPAAFPALVGALEDRDAGVRREAILALLKFGPAAKEAAGALSERERHDRDARVRAYAAKALEKLRDNP